MDSPRPASLTTVFQCDPVGNAVIVLSDIYCVFSVHVESFCGRSEHLRDQTEVPLKWKLVWSSWSRESSFRPLSQMTFYKTSIRPRFFFRYKKVKSCGKLWEISAYFSLQFIVKMFEDYIMFYQRDRKKKSQYFPHWPDNSPSNQIQSDEYRRWWYLSPQLI